MDPIDYQWNAEGREHILRLVWVLGTGGDPYRFGEGDASKWVEVPAFYVGTTPVTQALWNHVVGPDSNPSVNPGDDLPLENVSWDDIAQPGGFLDRLNRSGVRAAMAARLGRNDASFRLPSETEWEYAARGGIHWRDGFPYSGSRDVDAVAWYGRRHGDHTQPVARKAPNQLGIHDMSGNVWEWCHDIFTPDTREIFSDGAAFAGFGFDRVLRGGCFHNWAVHCRVSKRYEIAHDAHDGCIGFRLVLA
jgi:formylglycine-generating enzyme